MKNKIKQAFQSRKFKGGAYATLISIIVIIIVLLVNFIFSKLDIKYDVSSEGLYTLSDTSKDYIEELEEEITIYYLVESGNEDLQITEIIEQYGDLSDNITIEYKDPVLYPQFAQQYTDEQVSENSIIVVNESENRSKYVDYNDMFVSEIDYNTFQQSVTGIDVEGRVTSAIQYTTADNLPLVYAIEGHGEGEVTQVLRDSLERANININTLDTLSAKTIPEDCSTLLIMAPQTDYSEEETEMIKDYLQNGGNAIILADYNTKGLTNVNNLLEFYGITTVDGLVLEGDSNYYMGQYVNNLIPEVQNHAITENIIESGKSVVAPAATGLEVLDTARNTIETTSLLETSASSFSKVDVDSTGVNKEEGDIDGPFTVGLAVTENYNDVKTNIVVFGTPYIVSDSLIAYDSVGNLDILLDSINFVSQKEESVSVPAKNYGLNQLYLTANDAYLWGAITVLVIPIAILVIGGVTVYRRRKK